MSKLNDIFFTQASTEGVTYESILEDVQRYFTENYAATIASEGDAERAAELLKELISQYIVKRKYILEGLTTDELTAMLYEDMAGYSFLKKWIYMPGIEEVNINAYDDIEVIMNSGRGIKIPDKFSSPQQAIDVVRRMLSACGMVIDDTMPSVVGYLDKNIRISVDKAPIVDTDVGINASIRIINQQTVTREKLLNSGSATEEMLDFLNACIRYGVSVCIAGATGSGKTTIMAWLLSRVPYNRRLITLEEGSREFSLIVKDENGKTLNSVVHLLTRPHENPQLNIDQGFLLERILRKHPDVIGVGEMRSSREALAAAEASRTGHTVVTTIHSNSASQTYRRMMTLAKTRNAIDDETLMQIMVEAYPVIVFTKQLEDRSRKITEVIEGEDYTDGKLNFRSLYSFDVTDNITDEHGQSKVIGRHKKIGNISDTLKKRLLDNGISHKELDQFIKEVG
jgi:pilus assembly protein CpaF